MEPPVVFALILAVITFSPAPSYGQKIEASQNPLPVGSTVTLTSNVSVSTGAWTFQGNFIVFISGGNALISDSWNSRATFNSTTSALTIRSLQTQDSGLYRVQSFNAFGAELMLNVQVPISGVTLTVRETSLVEFNDTADFMCSVANGSSLSYVWMRDNFEIKPDERIQFSNDGASLTIAGVTRLDAGQYKCIVSNLLGSEVSPLESLNISHGPSDAIMKLMPEGNTYKTESNITLSCSADSRPSAVIQWMLNGTSLDNRGSQLQLKMVTENNSGYYECLFHNTVTMRFNSAREMIKIVKPIEAVHVTNTGGPAIAGEALTLNCDVNRPVSRIQWWKNQQKISADNSTILVNESLTLSPVLIKDGGEYQCEAFNEVSQKISSPFILEINYGPMKPGITGPLTALTGTTVKLNCSSDSFPPSNVSWHYNDTLLATTPELTIGPLALTASGNYTCMAFNSVTNKSSSAYTMLTVYAPVTTAEIKPDQVSPILDQTFSLTCETEGSVESIIWMHGTSPVLTNNTRTLLMDNTTLTFDPVRHVDGGHYRCIASNPLSHFTSANFSLEVFFGPMVPVIVGPEAVIPGENVTFTCYAESHPPSSYTWFFNDTFVVNTTKFFKPHVTSDMMGKYTCMAFNNVTGKNTTMHKILTVVEPIMSAHIVTPTPPPIEGHDYMLTCNVTGPAQGVSWTRDHEPLLEDSRTTMNMTEKTIQFNPILYNDTGKYRCEAYNAAFNLTSPPLMLYVNFGPEQPIIKGPSFGEIKQQVRFNCSAHSMPPSHFSWWFNGSQVANTSSFLTSPLTDGMSGEYTCMAHNNVTGKNSTNSKMLTVIDAVESVKITNKTRPIQNENFTLTCEVTGSYDSIYWMKDGMKLSMNSVSDANTSQSSFEGNILDFNPLTRDDDGIYKCVATTKAMSHYSNPYSLLTNYGPLSVTIYALDSALPGDTMFMKCSADSRPDCEYSWFFNDLNVPLSSGSILQFPVTNESDGTYICRARNPVINITMYQSKDFSSGAVGLHTQSKAALMMTGLLALSVSLFH